MKDSPVICAECRDTGTVVMLKDGNHLTCALCDDKPIWGSKPKWCPKREREQTYEQMVLPIIPEV